MKKILVGIFTFFSVINFASAKAFENEYLYCFPQHDSPGYAYHITLKQLRNGKIKAVVLKESSLFRKSSYSMVFDLKHIVNNNNTEMFINENHNIKLTVFTDTYSGSILAEVENGGELLCDSRNEDSVRYWQLDHHTEKEVNKVNLIILLNTY